MSLTEFSALVAAIAAMVGAFATVFGLVLVARGQNRIHTEVKTSNGLTMAALADRAEGRRILTDILPGDRTTAEQRYVSELDGPLDDDSR